MSSPTVIECANMYLWRNRRPVLQDINWKTTLGEQWFILGSNGSGKTSLIETLLGYLWPQKGKISLMGHVYGQTYLPGLREKVGYLSSWVMNRLASYQTAEDIIASGSVAAVAYYQERTAGLNDRIKRKLVLLNCEDLQGKVFGELSCGQQYRVLLARALINDPEVLVLDEPFALLDLKTRFQMLSLLERLLAERQVKQAVFITHHLDEVLDCFTHGLILKEGRVFFQGERARAFAPDVLSEAFDIPKEVLPASRYVR